MAGAIIASLEKTCQESDSGRDVKKSGQAEGQITRATLHHEKLKAGGVTASL